MPTIKLPDWRRSPFVAVSLHRSAHVMIRWGEAGVPAGQHPGIVPLPANPTPRAIRDWSGAKPRCSPTASRVAHNGAPNRLTSAGHGAHGLL
jgi:hypothetical protein